jgi:hypothetical protein
MVSRLEKLAKPTPSPARRRTAPDLTFLAAFLRTHREEILARWSEDTLRLHLSDEFSFLCGQTAALEKIHAQLQRLTTTGDTGNLASTIERDRLLDIQRTHPNSRLLPDFLQVFFTCSDSVRDLLLLRSPEFARLTGATREAVLRQVDMAFSILIHREIHAFSENCNRLQTGCDFTDIVRHTAFSEISLSPRAQTA